MRDICDEHLELDGLYVNCKIDYDVYKIVGGLIETVFWLQEKIDAESKKINEVSVKDLVRWIEEERAVGLPD